MGCTNYKYSNGNDSDKKIHKKMIGALVAQEWESVILNQLVSRKWLQRQKIIIDENNSILMEWNHNSCQRMIQVTSHWLEINDQVVLNDEGISFCDYAIKKDDFFMDIVEIITK